MLSPRLSGIAALGVLALVLSGCASDQQSSVGVDRLTLATLGSITPSEQAFVDRMNELSEGTVTLKVTENWQPSGGSDSPEDALAKAVLAGDVDIAWVTVRSLSSIGVKGIDAVEAPLLVQTHDQQRAVALGVPGELITTALKKTGVEGLALIPGPTRYPVAAGAPLLSVADWAGKTVQVNTDNPLEAATVQALGATAGTDGSGGVADIVSGAVQAATVDVGTLAPDGATKAGPFMTSTTAMWPEMSIIVVNRDILNRLSSRQHGFLDGSVVRAQDIAMAAPDLVAPVTAACTAGTVFGIATADQITEMRETLQPVYDSLAKDPAEKKLLAAIQDVVKRNAGTGVLDVPKTCRFTPPKS